MRWLGDDDPTTRPTHDRHLALWALRLCGATPDVLMVVVRRSTPGAYLSTATGLFHVYSKTQALTYDPPYDTYISDWVGFDPQLDNGFHSFLKDKDGHVVDASTGRISNGCIRTPQPEVVFAFAETGMPVYAHT
jgi:hypothetical protein